MRRFSKSFACAALAISLIAAGPAFAAEKLTILLDWYVNPDHATLFVAKEKGWLKDAGFDAELIAPADPNDPPKLVAAGKGDVAITYQPQLHTAVDSGIPLKRIGTLIGTPLNSLIMLADGPAKTIADLKGRKIGNSVGGFEDALLATMLAAHGLSLKDVTLVNVNFALAQSLMAGQVDAVIGAYRNFDPFQIRLAGKEARVFPVEGHGVPAYDELVLVVKSDRAADPRWARLMAVLERAAAFTKENPDAAWALFVKGRKEVDDQFNRLAFDATVPLFAARPAALDQTRYDNFASFLASRNLIRPGQKASDVAVEPRP